MTYQDERIQYNLRVDPEMDNKLQALNQKLSGGEWNRSDLMRAIITVALDRLAGAKVTRKGVLLVDGVPVSEVK